MSFTELDKAFKASGRKDQALRVKVADIKASYPQVISDTNPTNVQ
jgi:hypothetical protein